MDQAENLRNEVKLRHKKPTQIFTITSGKGGVGKSNVAVNLAVWFRRMGKRVIIFDGDFGLANVEVMFGTIPKHDLSDVIYKGMDIREAVTKGPMDIGFISGGSGIVALNNLKDDQITLLVENLSLLSEMCDILIVDTGAGIADNVLRFVLASPEVLLITTPEPSSLTDSCSLGKAMVRNPDFVEGNSRIRLIANKVTSNQEADQVFKKIDSVVRRFLGGKLDYAGMVPMDSALEKAVRKQKIVSLESPSSKSSRCFYEIASDLIGEKYESNDKGISRFFKFLTKTQE